MAECAQLTADLLAAARQAIYIEAQYLSAPCVGEMIEKRLREPDGPDVAVIMTCESHGLLERFAMGNGRDRLLRRLARADRQRRLRVMYPVVPDGEGEQQVLVHAKLTIVDDVWLRVGSANLNNRSIGLDTECDLTVEARDAADRAAITRLRNELLAEHLAVEAREVARALDEAGSLCRALDRLNRSGRLRSFPALRDGGSRSPLPGYWLLDPIRPFNLRQRLLGWAKSALSKLPMGWSGRAAAPTAPAAARPEASGR